MPTNTEEQNVFEAKQSLKAHIKFFDALLKHLNGSDQVLKGRAMWATWCLHRYINDGLVIDIETAMRQHGEKNPHA
jgi:hypothetical protein